jgi:hypothetical protein
LVREPRRLHKAFAIIGGGPVPQLGCTRRRKRGKRNPTLRDKTIDIGDEAREKRQESNAFARALRTELAERARVCWCPFLDASGQACAPSNELSLALNDFAGQLDLPQLWPEPHRQVPRAASVYADATRLRAR